MPQRSKRVGESVMSALKRAVPELQALYLFGSHASGEQHADSDVDLALLAPRRLDGRMRWELQEELATLLGCDLDLVDLRAASTVMRKEVLRTAELLDEADPAGRAAFEAMVLSSYARLNEERAGILADICRRGSVHG